MENKIKRAISILLTACFFIVMFSVAVTPAMADTTLKATSDKVNYLERSDVWAPYDNKDNPKSSVLIWASPGLNFGTKHQKEVDVKTRFGTTVSGYECSSPSGGSWGLCTSFAESVSDSKLTTSSWKKGTDMSVCKNLKPRVRWHVIPHGTVLATFKGQSTYPTGTHGHSVVFHNFVYDTSKNIVGMWVWDQNYIKNDQGVGVIAHHQVMFTGAGGNSDAGSYSIVKV